MNNTFDEKAKQIIKTFARRIIANYYFYRGIRFFNPMVNLFRRCIGVYDRVIHHRMHHGFEANTAAHGPAHSDYVEPIFNYYKCLGNIVDSFSYQPKISILIPIYKVKLRYLKQTLRSVVIQKYQNWEICAVDDASGDKRIKDCLNEYAKLFPDKFKYKIHQNNQHISETSNTALSMATGEYVGLLDHDDLIYPNALAEMVRFINYHEMPDILYSDERVVNGDGDPASLPFFKPDYLPQLHLAVNYTTHFSIYKKSLLDKIGGFRKGYEGSQDHDLMLRAVESAENPVVHVPLVLYQWRAHEDSTANDISTKNYAITNGQKAVEDALRRRKRKATVKFNKQTLHYDIDYKLINPDILVSIIIPNKNNQKLLEKCIQSIISKRRKVNFEIIIVDNQSTDEPLLRMYDEYQEAYDFIKIKKYEKPFNFAAINNFAAGNAQGEFIVFLNNDTEILSENWLNKLIQLAQFPEIGSVGAKLLYPNGLVQHAGILLLGRKVAGHAWINRLKDVSEYMNFLNTIHEVTAVTAACLCIEKKKFIEVGGFDEKWVPNGWGDVDFGLKLCEAGYSNIFTPQVEVRHYESPSRGYSLEYFEHFHIIQKYGGPLMKDKFLHPFFLRSTNFDIDHDFLTYDLNNKTMEFFLQNANSQNWNTAQYKKYEKH